jgi:GTPase SAR1 family protein
MGCAPSKVSPIIPITANNSTVGIDRQSTFLNENQDVNLGYLRDEFKNYEKILKHLRDILENYRNGENKTSMKIAYDELNNKCDDQKNRMSKSDYEVAIVGLEKAGKSTLINSWIGWNFLPTDANRCTYTLTKILSTDRKQRYEIEYFTKAEFHTRFDKIKDEYAKKNDPNSPLKAEIDEIRTCLNDINKYLDNSPHRVEVDDFNSESVKQDIRSYITIPSKARAIKNITFWVAKLNTINNFTLYDAPGYDSPITL